MNDKLAAIGEFLTTMGTGLVEAGKIAIHALTMTAALIGIAIAYVLPIWAILTTGLDMAYLQDPGITVWKAAEPGTILYYLQKTGQSIAILWIGRGIYKLGANERHG